MDPEYYILDVEMRRSRMVKRPDLSSKSELFEEHKRLGP